MSIRTLLYGQSLPVGRIRLIKLEPTNFSSNLVLCCCMTTETIEDAPPYNALSYRWGDKHDFEPILCNDKELWISSNLAKGLRRLRTSVHCADWLWIDQICINQKWADERTQQIQMMHHIFSRAMRTLVWLGEETDHVANKGFKLVREISQIALEDEQPDGIPNQDTASFVRELRGLNCLAHLLYNPWFLRVWVIQEVVLSKADPLLMWGSCTCTWSIFSTAVLWMQRAGLGNWQNPRLPLRRAQTLIQLAGSPRPWSLEALLQCSRRCQATDSRDAIFGLLAISEDSKSIATWPAALVPNYEKPAWYTYMDVARYLIVSTGSLSIFAAVQYGDDRALGCLPSWVPNWAQLKARAHLSVSAIAYEPNAEGVMVVRDTLNDASKGSAAQLDSADSPYVLRTRGVIWDLVDVCYGLFNFDPRLSSPETLALDTGIPETWCQLKTRFQDVDTAARAFFMATTCGRLSFERPYRSASSEPLDHFWAYVDDNREDCQGKGRTGNAARYLANIAVCDGRQIFITKQGCIGLGPADMRKGDTICVLFGGSVPYVVRPSGSGYELLGEVYVHGIMEGEVMHMLEAGRLQPSWIDLV